MNMQLFHGTDKESKARIIEQGFIKQDCSDFGLAVYFSDDIDTAKDYTFDNTVLTVLFNGNLLDLSNPEHFEVYKQCNGNTSLLSSGYDALKDNNVIAVFNLKSIILKPTT